MGWDGMGAWKKTKKEKGKNKEKEKGGTDTAWVLRYHGGFGFAYFCLQHFSTAATQHYPYFLESFLFGEGIGSRRTGGLLHTYIRTYIPACLPTHIIPTCIQTHRHTDTHAHYILQTDSNQTAVRVALGVGGGK